MAYKLNNPALITSLTLGDAIANGGTTPIEAGVTQTATTSAGGTITWQGDRYRFSAGAGVARLDETLGSFGYVTVEDLWNLVSAPTGSANRMYEFRHASNFAARIEMNTTRTLVVFNAANTAIWTSAAIPLGEFRVRITLNPDETAEANGDLTFNIFTSNPRSGTTPDQTFSTTASDFDPNALTTVRRGRLSSTAGSGAVLEYIWSQSQDTLSAIGPLAGPPAIDVVVGDASVWFDARGSDPGIVGDPLTYSIAHTTGPDHTLEIVEVVDGFFQIPQDSTVATYTITVTGTTGTDTEIVTVPALDTGAPPSGSIRRRRVGSI